MSTPSATDTRAPASDGCWVCGGPLIITGDLRRCNACGLRLRAEADGTLVGMGGAPAISYPEDGAALTREVEDTSFWFAHRNRVLDALLTRYPPRGTLWDVGGGNGLQARHFQRQGRSVVMLEPGPVGCRNARDRGVAVVVRSTLEDLALPAERLAALSAFDVIEHLADPHRLLAECRRLLRPGGRLYVTVPAFGFLWSDEDVYACHERRYTKATLTRQLERAGFEIEYVSYYFRALLLPILLLRTLPYRLTSWRKKPGQAQTMDQTEHNPQGLGQRIVARLLERELREIGRGERLAFGSSLVAVARRR